ncbi:MAG: NAD+ synthase [Bacteroidetes bacterium]|nr:NAD+ synthase [Bacteroidota bacterium]
MLKIALAQLNYTIGDFEKNVFKIKESIARAKAEHADLIVFSELCISGYPPRDFLEFSDFIDRCNKAAEEIASVCVGITAIVGCPTINPKPEGKNLFNSAYVCTDGKITDVIHKSLLPNYDIFDEYRYFEPNSNFHCISVKGKKIALTICEDLWNVEDDPMYVSSPMDELIREKPELMINIAASPFDYGHAEKRKSILSRNTKQYGIPLLYLNHVGAQTEIVFDGGSMAMNEKGEVTCQMKYFEEDFEVVEIFTAKTPILAGKTMSKIDRIHAALVLGIKDYFHKQNFTKAILGLSGGIDSAIVTCLATEALGKENVLPVLMPSQYSSEESVSDSVALCKNLGIRYEIIPIEKVYAEYILTLSNQFKGLTPGIAEENIQARIRGMLLMAMSNKFGHILLNTSNKSEIAVGYGTLYGDMCGGISVIGDVYKTEVYDLAKNINMEKEIIPDAIITKAPSAELRPGQKDSDSLPEYHLLDPILYQYIEKRKGPQELVGAGNDAALVKRILKLVNTNEYKRYQTPPILRVSPKAFGQGRRLPIVGKYLS